MKKKNHVPETNGGRREKTERKRRRQKQPARAPLLCRLKAIAADERGLGTLEIVIIIAVLLAVALIFRENIMSFASDLIGRVFNFSVLDGL